MKPKRTVKMPLRKPQAARRPAPARERDPELDYEIEDCEAEAEPNMRFSHALFVVLVLHVIAVAGVFAFNSIKARQTSTDPSKAAAGQPAAGEQSASSAPATAQTNATPAPAVSPAPRRTHKVAAGDTLSKIAASYKTTIEALTAANGISTSSILRIGQELVIPEPGARPAASPASPSERKKPALATVVASARPPAEPARPAAEKPGGPAPAARTAPASNPPAAAASPAPSPTRESRHAASPSPAEAPKIVDGFYVVAKGDNPYSIARRFGVSYKKLLEINGIQDPTKVQIGQKLKIPSAP